MRIEYETELYHHGLKGMKWFHRRFQNEDGSYTALGKLRYGIGQKARERANIMSEWSRQHTSKAAANASKIGSDGKYEHQHMISPVNARRARQAMTDHDTEAIRNMGFKWNADKVLGADYARKTASEIADKRLESRSRQVSGREDSLRSDAKLYEQQGGVSKPKEHWTGREAYEVRMRASDSKHAQADRMFERQMGQNNKQAWGQRRWLNPGEEPARRTYEQFNNKKSSTLGQRATNALNTAGDLANKYGRQALAGAQDVGERARQGAANLQANARKGLATAGVAAGLGVGAAGRDVYNTVNSVARAGNRAVNSAADRATNALNVASGLAGKYGRQAIAGAKGAAVAGLVAKNGLQLRAQDLAGRAGNAARSTSNEMREILKAYGKDIKGNAGNYINKARNAADLARTAVGVAGLDARDAAGRLGNRARDAAGYAKTAAGALRNLAGVYGEDAMNRARSARDNAVQRYVQYAYQKSADDPYKYEGAVSPVDARRNEIANRMLNKGPQTSMTGRTVNDYQREMIERAQRSAKTANYQSEMISRAQNLAREANEKAAAQRAAELRSARPRREQSGYMDRIQALQNANRYRADLAAAGGTRQYTNPALALGQAAQTVAGIANSKAGNLSAAASGYARRGFNAYKNEHPNSEMSFDEYKRKYGWMYGGV